MPLTKHKDMLDELYLRYNRRAYVHPDPVEFLYRYDDGADREVAALVASSLAYGRVAQILRSVQAVLAVLGDRPAQRLAAMKPASLDRALAGFKHRFATGSEMAALLISARRQIVEFGSLQACFLAGLGADDETVLPALTKFAARLRAGGSRHGLAPIAHLLSDPARGSACKRLNLMLRWLVRRDKVDLGDWHRVPAAKLIVPLDTHMHRLSRQMNATARRAADLRTAREITAAFAAICPQDPVKYDFALTRLGIHPQARRESLPCGARDKGPCR